jgi:glycosyltransferase involved in cell wall biosynthesis
MLFEILEIKKLLIINYLRGNLMNQSKVSVIVPVYNVEKYLIKCLDSIVNQTLQEIEIICVNDGSTDNSPKILKEYSLKDERIKIIDKENNGLGAARNTGIEAAKGEYIGFVDSDDWIELDAYEKLYKNAKSLNSDMVMCPAQVFDDTTEELKNDQPAFTLEYFDKHFDNGTFNHKDSKDFIFHITVTAWNKIYKTEFLNRIKARFPENLIFEDNPFFYETYLKADNVSLIRDPLFFYRINRRDSIISKADKKYFDVIKIFDIILKIFIDTNNFDYYKNDLIVTIFNNIFHRYYLVADEYRQEFFSQIKQFFDKIDIDDDNDLGLNYKNKYLNIKTSDSYKEFELKEKITQLELTHKNELERQKQVYEKLIEDKERIIGDLMSSNTWKVTKPIRKVGKEIKRLKR